MFIVDSLPSCHPLERREQKAVSRDHKESRREAWRALYRWRLSRLDEHRSVLRKSFLPPYRRLRVLPESECEMLLPRRGLSTGKDGYEAVSFRLVHTSLPQGKRSDASRPGWGGSVDILAEQACGPPD